MPLIYYEIQFVVYLLVYKIHIAMIHLEHLSIHEYILSNRSISFNIFHNAQCNENILTTTPHYNYSCSLIQMIINYFK